MFVASCVQPHFVCQTLFRGDASITAAYSLFVPASMGATGTCSTGNYAVSSFLYYGPVSAYLDLIIAMSSESVLKAHAICIPDLLSTILHDAGMR